MFTAVDAAFPYAFSHFFFIAVTLCSVNQAKSRFDGMAYSFRGILLNQECAYSQLRHFHAVIQLSRTENRVIQSAVLHNIRRSTVGYLVGIVS